MLKNLIKRWLALALIAMMVIPLLPQVLLTAHAAENSKEFPGVKVIGDFSEAAGGISCRADVAAESGCNGTSYTETTKTLTLQNTKGASGILRFQYTIKTTGGSVTINDEPKTGSGTCTIDSFGAGESIAITLNSGAKASNYAEITLSDIGLLVDEVMPTTFLPAEGGSFTVDGAPITAQVTIERSGLESYTLKAVPAEGYKFVGWYSNGKPIGKSANWTVNMTQTQTITPRFVSSDSPVFQVGAGNEFYDLHEAVAFAQESGEKDIILIEDGVLFAGEYVVPGGITLLIPYNDVHTLCTTEPMYHDKDKSSSSAKAYKTLTMAAGSHITVQPGGAVSVSARAQNTTPNAGVVLGPWGLISMNADSSITLESGANLYCWGFITGQGSVLAKSGAKVYENFQVPAFRGGNASASMNGGKKNKVFPFTQFYIQNIEVPMTMEAGASEQVHIGVIMSVVGLQSGGGTLIGQNDGLFRLQSGTLTKRYDGETDRLVIEVDGDAQISEMKVKMGSAGNIESSKFVVPITNNMTVHVRGGHSLCIAYDMAMLPGAQMIVDEDADLTLADGKNFYIYDQDEWIGKGYADGYNRNFADLSNVPGRTYKRTEADLVDARLDINGTMTVNGALYTTAGGADITSSAGTGQIMFSGSAGTEKNTYQVTQSGNTVTANEVSITPARLRNAEILPGMPEPEYSQTASAVANDVFAVQDGIWHKNLDDNERLHYPHTPGEIVQENKVDATCIADGSYDAVFTCTVCGATVRETIAIPALGHDYAFDSWGAWIPAADGGYTVAANLICQREGCPDGTEGHVKAETEGVTVQVETVDATCTEGGTATYTAAITIGEAEYVTEPYTVQTVRPLGHTYGAPVWAEDHATVSRTCGKCGDVQTANADITDEVTLEPTYETTGVRTYTATATFAGETEAVIATWTEEIPKLTPPYNLHSSIADKLTGAKFVGVVASTNLNGETTEVVGTVDEKYKATLHIPNADVNANSLWLGVGMNGVESLGGGQRIHALPEKHLMGDSDRGADLNIFTTLRNFNLTALEEFNGATINATIVPVSGESAAVRYTLESVWTDADGKTITGTPDSAGAARMAWHTMVNDTNFATPANNGDSQIVIKNGSWLQIGDQRLQFAANAEGDITLFTADGDSVASICDKVELANGEAGVTLAFLLKEGTTLAVGDSSAVLKNDVLVNVTGIAAEKLTIDGKNALVALREAVNSGETPDMVSLLVQLAGLMDTAVAAVDGSDINVEMQFICNHTAGEAVRENIVAATCTMPGGYDEVVYCTKCGAVISRVSKTIPVIAHTLTKTEAKAATCTEAGNIAYWTCEICEGIFSDNAGKNPIAQKDTILNALGHTSNSPVRENEVAATCIETGCYDEVVYCKVCKDEMSRKTVTVNALGHDLTQHEAQAATCTEIGWEAYETCSRCDHTTYQIIQAFGHQYDAGVITTTATCTEDGEKTFTCIRGDDFYTESIPATGHHYGEAVWEWLEEDDGNWTATVTFSCENCEDAQTPEVTVTEETHDATCTGEGLTIYTAAAEFEGERYQTVKDDIILSPTGHVYGPPEWEWDDGNVSATFICANCGERQTEIAEVNETVADATCTLDGAITYTARVWFDGQEYTDSKIEVLPAVGHTEEIDSGIAATCTAPGLTEGSHCAICGDTLITQTEIPAIGHNWGVGEITIQPTCMQEGERTYTCANDAGHVRTEPVTKAAHTLTHVEAAAAGCLTAGHGEYWQCAVCEALFDKAENGQKIELTDTVIPAVGHSYGAPAFTWMQNDQGGWTAEANFVCLSCQEESAVNAAVSVADTKTPDCTQAGVRVFTAAASLMPEGNTYTEIKEIELPALGHTYQESWRWEDDNTGAALVLTCERDKTHTETVEAAITTQTTPATTKAAGKTVYTATAVFADNTYTDTREREIPRLTTSGGKGGGGGGGGGRPSSSVSIPVPPVVQQPNVPVETEITDNRVPLAETPFHFIDVKEDNWFYQPVEYVYHQGMMNGTSDMEFSPAGTTTRAAIATMLYRLEGEPAALTRAGFSDVQSGAWYTEAVDWAVGSGVVTGYDADTFGPGDNITREQLAAMLYRYENFNGRDTSAHADLSKFADAERVSGWAYEAVSWAVGVGLLQGNSDGLNPTGTATRAEAATILMRLHQMIQN